MYQLYLPFQIQKTTRPFLLYPRAVFLCLVILRKSEVYSRRKNHLSVKYTLFKNNAKITFLIDFYTHLQLFNGDLIADLTFLGRQLI